MRCCFMIDRDTNCPEPVAGKTALASDESSGKPLQFCRKHLQQAEADNRRYEEKLETFVRERVPLYNPDDIGTRTLTLGHRDEMLGDEVLLAYWCCRKEVCALIPRDDLTYTERTIIGNTLRACCDFLEMRADTLTLNAEFLKPWHTGQKTVGEATTEAQHMLDEIKATVLGSSFEQADVIMNRYYRAADPKYKQRIRNHYLKLLRAAS